MITWPPSQSSPCLTLYLFLILLCLHRWSCWICTLREPRLQTATAAVLQMCRPTANRMFSYLCPTCAFGNVVVPPSDIGFFFIASSQPCWISPGETCCSSQSADLSVSRASFHLWVNVKVFGLWEKNNRFLIGNRSSMIGIASLNGAKRISLTSKERWFEWIEVL